MGTVLHPVGVGGFIDRNRGFSPLLDGDGSASLDGLRLDAPNPPSFSPLLDGDGSASAPEEPHSTTLARRLDSPLFADRVSVVAGGESANLAPTTRLHNSLRTRILRTAF